MTKRKLAINKKAKREIDKFPLVEIKWLDITSNSSWQDIEDFLKVKLPLCTTKGHLLSQSKGLTRVFGDFALKDEKTGQIDEIANTTIIPNSVIIEIKKI
jgi:hypothetical protein